MSRTPKKKPKPPRTTALAVPPAADFDDVLRLIAAARGRAVAAVNKELIELYWDIGEHISRKIAAGSWGERGAASLLGANRGQPAGVRRLLGGRGRGEPFFVPEGRPRVAQHFSAGYTGPNNPSSVPEGRLNRRKAAARPSLRDGRGYLSLAVPSTEVLGYSRPSLRDEERAHGTSSCPWRSPAPGRLATPGEGTVPALAEYIRRRQPAMSGFSASNLWRMRQFYETYRGEPKLAPLVRELSWTHNLLIMSRCKREEAQAARPALEGPKPAPAKPPGPGKGKK